MLAFSEGGKSFAIEKGRDASGVLTLIFSKADTVVVKIRH